MIGKRVYKNVCWIFIGILTFIIYLIFFVLSFVIVNIDKCWTKEKECIDGDVAVITGAAGGLGKCIATELAAEGCHVAICDINYELAVTTAKEIANKYSVKAKAYKVNVVNYEEIKDLNEKLTEDIGAATILVNNAGVLVHSDQLNPPVEDVQLMINVNYLSHFWTNRVFLKNMRQAKKGHIVAISSASGLVALPFSEPYCSSKTAVRTLMRTLRAELKLEGMNYIGCTTVFPYFLHTHADVEKLAYDIGFTDIYPLLKGEEVAKAIVQGMLHGEVEIAIPGFFMLTYRLISLLPSKAQDWLTYMPFYKMDTYNRLLASLKRK